MYCGPALLENVKADVSGHVDVGVPHWAHQLDNGSGPTMVPAHFSKLASDSGNADTPGEGLIMSCINSWRKRLLTVLDAVLEPLLFTEAFGAALTLVWGIVAAIFSFSAFFG